MDAPRREPVRKRYRRPLALDRAEPPAERRQYLFREARADPARINESAAGRMVGDEKSAEPGACARGIGEADYDEVLALAGFHLDPLRSAPRPIERGAALRHDSLQPVLTRGGEKFRALADLVIAEPDRRRRRLTLP